MGFVTLLIGRFKQGSDSAFGLLVGQFHSHVARLADRRILGWGKASQLGEDIAQLVFFHLYRAVGRRGRLAFRLRDTPTLLTTLAMLTRQQVGRHWRDETRACRDFRRTRLAADLSTAAGADPLDKFVSDKACQWLRDIQCRETLEQLLALLPEVRYKAVVHLLLQGHSIPEIAQELGRGVRAVQRYLVEIRSTWQNHAEEHEILAGRVPPRPMASDDPQ
jgi:DNA-directed RNA polymerase specialized sigma24 family protein